jgi:serine/threonine-protein kinase
VSAPYRFRAYAYLELGDRIRALNDLDQAIRLNPNEVQLYADRAAELYAQKAFDQALADCDKVLKLDPGRAPMYGLRARCHAERGDSDSAFKDFVQAIAGDPENASRYLIWRAQLQLECDNFTAAEADASEVISREPGNPDAYHTRGTIRQQKGEIAEANQDFSTALRLKPDHALARIGRAMCHLMQKNYVEAIVDCDRAIELLPGIVKSY